MRTLFRIVLVLPALLVSAALLGGSVKFSASSSNSGGSASSYGTGGLATVVAFLGWFASIVRGKMPKGLRDAGAYGLGYSAQMLAYLLFVTDRYPNGIRRASSRTSSARRSIRCTSPASPTTCGARG